MADAPARKRSSSRKRKSRKRDAAAEAPAASGSSSSSPALPRSLQTVLEQVQAGDELAGDRATEQRLFALKRRGLVERERVDGVDSWTVAGSSKG